MDYLNLTYILVVSISALWVYQDTKKHKIGKIPGKNGLLNMSAGGMAGTTLGLWIITFPLYLYKRKQMIEQARENPVEPSGKIIFAVAGVIFAAFSVSLVVKTTLPGCDSQEALKLANQIAAPLQKGAITYPAEQGYEDGVRVCRGFLVGENGQQLSVDYAVSWHDKAKQIIYVRILR